MQIAGQTEVKRVVGQVDASVGQRGGEQGDLFRFLPVPFDLAGPSTSSDVAECTNKGCIQTASPQAIGKTKAGAHPHRRSPN